MMKMRKARISCSCCGEKSTIDVPLVEELSRVTICPNCGAEGNLLSDFFFSFPADMESMSEREIREMVLELFLRFGEIMASAIIEMAEDEETSPISKEDVEKFRKILNKPKVFWRGSK